MKKLLFLFALSLSSLAVWAQDFFAVAPTGQTLRYNIIDDLGSVQVISDVETSVGLTGVLTIPETVIYHGGTYSVTTIGEGAFAGCDGLTSVNIPNSVTTIGEGAFAGCSGLTNVNIPNSVTTIGEWAFYGIVNYVNYCGSASGNPWGAYRGGCFYEEGDFVYQDNTKTTLIAYIGSDSSVSIPNSVITIDNYAFYRTEITSVTIGENVQNINNQAFLNCTRLTTVNFNADSCVYMGNDGSLFSGCTALTTIIIGENVKVIPDYAFYGTGITSVTIPHNVRTIGIRAFANCSQLTTVNFNADSCINMGSFYSSNRVFYGCTALTTLNIGDNVKVIPDHAFYETGITSVTIPHNVRTIGGNAFANCSQLATVNYNADSCVFMGMISPFSGCTSLTTLNIGENVKNIPDYAFSGIGITSATIPHNVQNIGYSAFSSCTQLTTVNFNADSCTCNMVSNGYVGRSGPFLGCTSLTTLNIGDNVKIIPDYAFSVLSTFVFGISSNLSTVNFGNNVRSIGLHAFSGCSALSTIELPASLERIGPCAFQGTHLTSIVIPQHVTVIDTALFSGCNYLTSVVLPDSLEEIKYDAFYNCSALDSIIIPSTVTQIGSYAFAVCTSLQHITMLNPEPPTIVSNTFMDVPTNASIFVPCGASDIYRNASFWNNFTNFNENDSCFMTLSLNCNNAMMGTLMGVGRYSNNSNVTIAAIPYTGYQFLGWNDGDTTNPRTIQVFSDTTFTATFAAVAETLALHNVTVMSSNASMGSAVGSGVYQEGCSLSIMALPNSGYAFSGWHDGNTDNPRTILVNSDGYYIASFISAPISSDTVLVHDTTYIDVHDTTVVHDTTFVPVHDTTIVHDTTFIHVHDTTIVHDTTFVPVHDTTIVYDTTFVTVYDTTIVHDTTFVPVHDTTIVHDTTFVTVYDTTIVHDTTIITVTDTIVQPITYYDLSVTSGNISQGLVAGNGHFPEGTMVEIAAIPMEGYRFEQWDDGNTDNPRVVEVSGDITFEASFDASTEAIGNVDNQEYIITTDKGSITIQGAAHQRIRIFDCLGRLLTTEMNTAEYKTFMVPASGAYMVQIGDNPAKRVVVIR